MVAAIGAINIPRYYDTKMCSSYLRAQRSRRRQREHDLDCVCRSPILEHFVFSDHYLTDMTPDKRDYNSVCQNFLRGSCRFGNRCFNYHPEGCESTANSKYMNVSWKIWNYSMHYMEKSKIIRSLDKNCRSKTINWWCELNVRTCTLNVFVINVICCLWWIPRDAIYI